MFLFTLFWHFCWELSFPVLSSHPFAFTKRWKKKKGQCAPKSMCMFPSCDAVLGKCSAPPGMVWVQQCPWNWQWAPCLSHALPTLRRGAGMPIISTGSHEGSLGSRSSAGCVFDGWGCSSGIHMSWPRSPWTSPSGTLRLSAQEEMAATGEGWTETAGKRWD